MATNERGGTVKQVRHGFPPVPGDVTQAHVLRRFLQGLRDALQNFRWLFEGLGDLTSNQQQRLIVTLRGLAGVQATNSRQQKALDEQALTLAAVQDAVDALALRVDDAETQLDALEAWRLTVDDDLVTIKSDIQTIKDSLP